MRKLLSSGAVLVGLVAGLLVSAPGNGAFGAPPTNPAVTDASYMACNRVFSDPHAFWPAPTQVDPDRSPYAKGAAACAATDFYSYNDVFVGTPPAVPSGMDYLEGLFPRFINFINLEQDFGTGKDCPTAAIVNYSDLCSAGLPRQGAGVGSSRVHSNLFMVRVTDESSPIAEADKKHFAFPLSIHGIERAGAEAGVRMAEDLATWGYCEAVMAGTQAANGKTNCALEGTIPHRLLETQPAGPENLTTGDVLRESTVYFVFANADGWRRGDPDNLVRFYQRYNGNGVDMNRDWPSVGFTNRPYTPWSEPETRGFGEVLKEITGLDGPNGRPWAGGIDLHGQLIDRAYSFTLMGASERDYGKDQRILQVVKGAWADAELRLGWHPLIIPNNAPPPTCVPSPVGGNVCDHMYGVQWGTVWDTIAYQVTGAFGDWIDSPLGLGGDGIDNEMTLSHLGNCGIGSCYLIDFEQLHVDGNKSLVYAMLNYSLLPEDQHLEAPGKVAYIVDPTTLTNPGTTEPTPPPDLTPQPDQVNIILNQTNNFTHSFTTFGPTTTPAHYNGGLEGKATPVNIFGLSGNTATSSVIAERQVDDGEPPIGEDAGCGAAGDDWTEVNRYFNQASTYAQAGQAVHVNAPLPGLWRICVTGGVTTNVGSLGFFDLDLTFSGEKAWEDPGQLAYSVSNRKFFEELAPFMDPGQLVPLQVSDVTSTPINLRQFNTIVVADNPAPGLTDPSPEMTIYKDKLLEFARRGGNLVLTDGALKLLGNMGFVTPSNVARQHFYAGFTAFTSNGGSNNTYADPLAVNLNQPGAAEGPSHRHQTYEPVPLGFDIGSRSSCSGEPPAPPPPGQTQTVSTCTSPHWTVTQTAWQTPLMGANARTVGQTNNGRTVLGELQIGCGRVRIAGALLPMPVERYYHPFGLANYALTYSGWQVFKNLVQWNRPRVTSRGTSIPC